MYDEGIGTKKIWKRIPRYLKSHYQAASKPPGTQPLFKEFKGSPILRIIDPGGSCRCQIREHRPKTPRTTNLVFF